MPERDLGGAFGKARYAREELVAELGAVLQGERLEIGSELQSHAAYLEHWIALLQAEPQVLFQVLGEARQALELIALEVGALTPTKPIHTSCRYRGKLWS